MGWLNTGTHPTTSICGPSGRQAGSTTDPLSTAIEPGAQCLSACSIAFMAGSLVAYFAELVVMTAPPVARPSSRVSHDVDEDDDEYDYEANEPVSLPAIRAERDAAVDESRAA